jgi:hypothetical protein
MDTQENLCHNHAFIEEQCMEGVSHGIIIMEAELIEGSVTKLTEGLYVRGGVINEGQFIPHRQTDEQGRGISRGSHAGGAGSLMVARSALSRAEKELVLAELQVSPPALYRFG